LANVGYLLANILVILIIATIFKRRRWIRKHVFRVSGDTIDWDSYLYSTFYLAYRRCKDKNQELRMINIRARNYLNRNSNPTFVSHKVTNISITFRCFIIAT